MLTYTNTKVNKLNEGVPFAKKTLLPTDFWEFLDTWGGTWMWESIYDSQQSKHNLSWLVVGMKLNTLTWVTDSLYDRKRAADLCGVGWVIFCSKTGLRLTGTFWEITIGEFIPGRNAWTMFPTPPCQRAFRILSDSGVGSYLVLRQ